MIRLSQALRPARIAVYAAFIAFLLAGPSSVFAQWTWTGSQWADGIITQPTLPLSTLVGDANASLMVGDKTFTFPDDPSTFRVNDSDVSAVRDTILVSGYTYAGELGLLFSSNALIVNDISQMLDVVFEFYVEAPSPLIIGASMIIPQGGATVVEGTKSQDDVLTISETLYPYPPDVNDPPLTTPLFVGIPEIVLGQDTLLPFDMGPINPAQQKITVLKNIQLIAGEADGGSIQLHQFAQTFKQVPEPGTLVLAAAGFALVVGRRRRAR